MSRRIVSIFYSNYDRDDRKYYFSCPNLLISMNLNKSLLFSIFATIILSLSKWIVIIVSYLRYKLSVFLIIKLIINNNNVRVISSNKIKI